MKRIHKWCLCILPAVITCSLVSCSSPTFDAPVSPMITGDNYTLNLDASISAREKNGNSADIFVEGEKTYLAMTTLIQSAEHHIHIASLNFDTDEDFSDQLGLQIAQLLMEKVRSGVEVRIILDPIYQKVFVNDQIVQDLRSAGAVVRYYVVSEEQSVPDQLIFRTHQKLMVVDGAEAITGGSNFGTRYLSENQWRDTNVKLSGPIVADIQAEFAATWQSLTNESLTDQTYFPTLNDTGSVNARYLMQKPADRVFEIDAAVLLAIRMASQKIVIETPYFNPPDWLADELIAKATDGVDISILTNSEQTIDQTPLYWAGALRFPSLIENGINIFLWNRGERTLHSKVMAVDDFFAMISSYNFGYRSAIWDVENAVIFTQPEMVNAISSILNDDLSQPFIVNASPELIQTEYQSNQWMWNLTDDFHWLFKSEQ